MQKSNPQPIDYKSIALPVELIRHIYLFSIPQQRIRKKLQYKKSHASLHDSFQNYLLNFPMKNLISSGSVENRTPYAHSTFLLGYITNSLPSRRVELLSVIYIFVSCNTCIFCCYVWISYINAIININFFHNFYVL